MDGKPVAFDNDSRARGDVDLYQSKARQNCLWETSVRAFVQSYYFSAPSLGVPLSPQPAKNLPTIRSKLALIVLACAVPAVIGYALLINHYYDREREQLRLGNLLTARTLVQGVDRDLNSAKFAVLALSNSRNIVLGDFAAFHAEASKLLSVEFPGYNFVLADSTGQLVVNTLRPYGQALPRHANPQLQQQVLSTGKPVISNLFIGDVARRPLVAIEVPVRVAGKIRYTLGVGLLPERLGQMLTAQHLHLDSIAAIFDSEGVIVARTHLADRFVGQKGAPLLLAHMALAMEGDVQATTVEGTPVYSYFSRSPVSHWAVAIGVPRSAVRAVLLHSIVWVALIVFSILLAGFGLSWYMGGSIRRTVMALAAPADGIGMGMQATALSVSFKEAKAVATELAQCRYELESLVQERTQQLTTLNTQLAESRRMNRAVTDNMPGLVSYWGADLCCRFANKQFTQWFNKTPEELIGIRLPDLLGESLYRQSAPFVERALGGEPQNFERPLTKVSGEIRQGWVNYIPDFDADGAVDGMFVIVTDLTELKLAQAELRIAATAFDSHEAMMITDADSVILRVNRAFTAATGYAAEEIVGKKPSMLSSGYHDAHFYKLMWERIRAAGSWMGEIWDRHKDGRICPYWSTISAVKDANDSVSHYVCTLTDITARKASEESIKQLAFFDPLTGLPNRRLLLDRLSQSMSASARHDLAGALMFIDLDNFKTVNDTLGHEKGDLLLHQVATRLKGCVREAETVARLGGDEFVVVLNDLSESTSEAEIQAQLVGDKILAALNQPYDLDGHSVKSTPSIGVALFNDREYSVAEVLRNADTAMYQAKASGRNKICLYQGPAFASANTMPPPNSDPWPVI